MGNKWGTTGLILELVLLDSSTSDPDEGTEGKYIKLTADTKAGAITTLDSQAAVQWDLDRGRKGLTGPHEIQQG